MKTIVEQKECVDQNNETVNDKEDEIGEKLSISPSCHSGYQGSIQSSQKDRYYASFTFKFKNHRSFDSSCYFSQGDQIRMDEFFDDEVIFQRKVQRKDIVFRSGCLNSKFIKHATQKIYKFCSQAKQETFNQLLEELSQTQTQIFEKAEEDSQYYTLNQSLQDLLYRKEHTFLIYTFDWSICHLTFVCCILIYWMQIQIQDSHSDDDTEQEFRNSKRREYIEQEKIKLKQNICYVASSYAVQRSQQINANQPVLLILYNFLNYMKRQPCLNIVEISVTQDKLINDIKLFRRIKRNEKQFQITTNDVIFESQQHKYQFENKLITSEMQTYLLINFICIHNFVSFPLLRYYQLDGHAGSRTIYQHKKDLFCLWVLNIILNECQRKKADSVHNAALYIFTFMSILKRFKKDSNLEGISYLLPILANIKVYMPKVWKHAKKARPEIQKRLAEYEKKLMKRQYKTQQISQQNAVIWGETLYELAKKMQKYVGKKDHIELEQHRKFYEQILVHFLHYRRNLQKEYRQQIDKLNKDKEIGYSFNMYFLDTYVPRMYQHKNTQDEWAKFIRRAENVDKNISTSLYQTILDFCFVGSTHKYHQMEI